MAKTTRRKFYKRKSNKWASNIVEIEPTTTEVPTGINILNVPIVKNLNQSVNYASSVFTVKNTEVNLEFEVTSAERNWNIEGITYYIMYVPEGMNVSTDYNLQHPEYIMCYKYFGSPNLEGNTDIQQKPVFKVKSRLSRNLNTGDQIILLIKLANTGTANIPISYNGLVRFWTKTS